MGKIQIHLEHNFQFSAIFMSLEYKNEDGYLIYFEGLLKGLVLVSHDRVAGSGDISVGPDDNDGRRHNIA